MIGKKACALSCFVFVSALGIARPMTASAQTSSDPIAARALFDDGRALAAKGKYDQACPKFEESQRLDPGMGTLFNWADCLDHTGKTASAWVRFLEVAAQAKAAGQAEREKIARERAAALEPKLSKLTIHVRSTDSGLEVTRDGVALGKVVWGTAVPVDPGSHVVTARAPSKKTLTMTVQVAGNAAHSNVTIPALEAEPEGTTPPATVPAGQPTATEPPGAMSATGSAVAGSNAAIAAQPAQGLASSDVSGSSSSRKTQLALGYAAGGVGVVALVVGGVFMAQTISKNNEATGMCPGEVEFCPVAERHNQLVEDAKTARTISTVSFVVGGLALAGGIVLLATAPSQRAAMGPTWRTQPSVASGASRLPAVTWRLEPTVGMTGGGVQLGGAW